ncbi:MAG TPA: hypothetical protein VL022_10530 [Moheibacter sp.]|nr:hypothetical protein [Moheibacter sp.]
MLLGIVLLLLGLVYFSYLLWDNYEAKWDEYSHLLKGYYAAVILILLG